MKFKRVTIRDVADRVGCGVATVSRVLNDSGPASAETRARVLDAAAQLGFRFNELGRSLQSRRSRTLAVLVPSLLNPVFASAIQGVQAAATEEGYQILLACADYDEEAETRALGTFLAKQVDGAILTVANPDDSAALDLLRQSGVPYCLMFNQPRGPEPSVGVDNLGAAYAAGRALLSQGHVELAFVALRFQSSERARLRYQGFAACLREAGASEPKLVEVDHPFGGMETDLAGLFAQAPEVTGLFASNDMLALACLRAAGALGLQTPEDLSIVGFDGIPVAELTRPSLATIETPSEEMGRRAAAAVIRAIQADRAVPAGTRFLDFRFRPGASLGSPGSERPKAADRRAEWPDSPPVDLEKRR